MTPLCFFAKTDKGLVLLLVYVDDIVITGNDSELISQLQEHLQRSFHMKDLGPLQYFLGLEVHSTSAGIFLHEHKYIQELIALAGLQDGRSVDTPLEVNVKNCRDEGDFLSDPSLYRQLAPRHLHLAAVRHIIRYLLGTSSRGLFFSRNSPDHLVAYSDADWAGCSDTRRSVTGEGEESPMTYFAEENPLSSRIGRVLIELKGKKKHECSTGEETDSCATCSAPFFVASSC
nr:uncharacterized mitochondrial protein AtMg00810-like isoform X2 [Coffea arabica]